MPRDEAALLDIARAACQDLLKKAKQVAAERSTTLTALVIEGLTRATSGDDAYQEAWQRQKALMEAGHLLREGTEALPPRDAAHER
jgi:hypothetical protein